MGAAVIANSGRAENSERIAGSEVAPAPLSSMNPIREHTMAARFQTLAVRLVFPWFCCLSNLGGNPEHDDFVEGVTESLTTDLSQFGNLFVISRNSAFSYKGKEIDVRQVGRELNVRYVLEGSVQRNGGRLRVNVQLIDAENGKHLWAERFEKPLGDLFNMQDEIVSRLAYTLHTPTRSSRGATSRAFNASRCKGPEFSRCCLLIQGVDP